jgi:hypothetical protein
MSRELFTPDPVVGFRFIPNLATRVAHEGGGYLLKTNAQGFRSSQDFVAEKPPGVFRLMLFGDSYTAGDGVSHCSRYSDILEADDARLQVYNFALPGTGTDQHYLVYREFAKDIPCDLVVIAVQVENIRRIVARYRSFQSADGKPYYLAKPYFELQSNGKLELRGLPVSSEKISPESLPESELAHADLGGDWHFVRSALQGLAPAVKRLMQRAMKPNPVPAYDSPDDPAWRLMQAILTQWIAEIGVPVIVMPLPLYHFVEDLANPAGYIARFRELGESARNSVGERPTIHNPLPLLRSFSAKERLDFRFENDPHPTAKAHAVIAESLKPIIAGSRSK